MTKTVSRGGASCSEEYIKCGKRGQAAGMLFKTSMTSTVRRAMIDMGKPKAHGDDG